PVATPCSRRFGWGCLLHYYPHRCGGWSPLRMVRKYTLHARPLKLLRHYRAVVTASQHMRPGYPKHRPPPDPGHALGYLTFTGPHGQTRVEVTPSGQTRLEVAPLREPSAYAPGDNVAVNRSGPQARPSSPWRLLFLGRMDQLKGGEVLLEALPRVMA